jgi:hypothetical protein
MLAQTLKIVLISALIGAIISVGVNFIPNEKINSSLWYISIIFHVAITFLLNAVLFKKNTDPKDFIFKIMFTSMGRLLLCMIGVFIYSLADKEHFAGFAMHFMLHYIIFTIIELNFLLKYIKIQSK